MSTRKKESTREEWKHERNTLIKKTKTKCRSRGRRKKESKKERKTQKREHNRPIEPRGLLEHANYQISGPNDPQMSFRSHSASICSTCAAHIPTRTKFPWVLISFSNQFTPWKLYGKTYLTHTLYFHVVAQIFISFCKWPQHVIATISLVL